VNEADVRLVDYKRMNGRIARTSLRFPPG